MITLEAGKLYQVKSTKGWIIAEYVKENAAHSYKYTNLSFDTFKTGPEKVRHVPLSHLWKKIGYNVTNITIEDRGMEVRPASSEALLTIGALKTDITRLNAELEAKRKELREFCN